MKRPSFQFYPGDWQRDNALRSCTVGARGLWIEMICIMHQADPYGHLVINGNAIDDSKLALMVASKVGPVRGWLAELEKAGVFDKQGETIVSRRMVKDENLRKIRAASGALGGNPSLMDNVEPIDKVNLPDKQNLTPSSSSSVSSSKDQKRVGKPPDASPVLITLPTREGVDFEVRQSFVDQVEPLCPAVDVPATLKEMKLWLIGNEQKRKTGRGMKRFMTTWLKSEQEKHGR